MNADDSAAHEAVLRTWLDSGIWIADKPVREALAAVLDENVRMREELAALIEAQPSLQGSAFRIGWQTCRDKVNRTTELLKGELAALEYAEEVRKLNAEPSPDPDPDPEPCQWCGVVWSGAKQPACTCVEPCVAEDCEAQQPARDTADGGAE